MHLFRNLARMTLLFSGFALSYYGFSNRMIHLVAWVLFADKLRRQRNMDKKKDVLYLSASFMVFTALLLISRNSNIFFLLSKKYLSLMLIVAVVGSIEAFSFLPFIFNNYVRDLLGIGKSIGSVSVFRFAIECIFFPLPSTNLRMLLMSNVFIVTPSLLIINRVINLASPYFSTHGLLMNMGFFSDHMFSIFIATAIAMFFIMERKMETIIPLSSKEEELMQKKLEKSRKNKLLFLKSPLDYLSDNDVVPISLLTKFSDRFYNIFHKNVKWIVFAILCEFLSSFLVPYSSFGNYHHGGNQSMISLFLGTVGGSLFPFSGVLSLMPAGMFFGDVSLISNDAKAFLLTGITAGQIININYTGISLMLRNDCKLMKNNHSSNDSILHTNIAERLKIACFILFYSFMRLSI